MKVVTYMRRPNILHQRVELPVSVGQHAPDILVLEVQGALDPLGTPFFLVVDLNTGTTETTVTPP